MKVVKKYSNVFYSPSIRVSYSTHTANAVVVRLPSRTRMQTRALQAHRAVAWPRILLPRHRRQQISANFCSFSFNSMEAVLAKVVGKRTGPSRSDKIAFFHSFFAIERNDVNNSFLECMQGIGNTISLLTLLPIRILYETLRIWYPCKVFLWKYNF